MTDNSHGPHVPLGAGTTAIHAGEHMVQPGYSLTTPVYLTSTYVFPDSEAVAQYRRGELQHPEYGRYDNPTQRVAAAKIAALEGTESALMFASGMAAITTALLALLKSGDHIILTHDCYHGTRDFANLYLSRFGITNTIVKTGDMDALVAAIRPQTKLIFTETPTNPYLNCVDLAALAGLGRDYGIKTMVDSTFATPLNTRPADFGIDLIIHSCTKFLAGHNDTLSGVLCGQRSVIEAIRELQAVSGGIVGPMDAYLLIRGLKTLELRVERQNHTSLHIAEMLHEHPAVERVYFPLHPSHPHYKVAKRQMKGGGGVVSFVVRGGITEARRVVDALRIPKFAPSLGGVESLVQVPALLSYGDLSAEEREAIGIEDGLIRFSVGIEGTDDLVADLKQAVNTIA